MVEPTQPNLMKLSKTHIDMTCAKDQWYNLPELIMINFHDSQMQSLIIQSNAFPCNEVETEPNCGHQQDSG
jgi:hypothetical protein